jgi:uncharacterized Fe-S center protein
MGMVQTPFMPDAGILFSADIAAIDRASLDLADRVSGGKFNAVNPINKNRQFDFARESGLGDGAYELTEA